MSHCVIIYALFFTHCVAEVTQYTIERHVMSDLLGIMYVSVFVTELRHSAVSSSSQRWIPRSAVRKTDNCRGSTPVQDSPAIRDRFPSRRLSSPLPPSLLQLSTQRCPLSKAASSVSSSLLTLLSSNHYRQ